MLAPCIVLGFPSLFLGFFLVLFELFLGLAPPLRYGPRVVDG